MERYHTAVLQLRDMISNGPVGEDGRLTRLAEETRLARNAPDYENVKAAFHRRIAEAARNVLFLTLLDAVNDIASCEQLGRRRWVWVSLIERPSRRGVRPPRADIGRRPTGKGSARVGLRGRSRRAGGVRRTSADSLMAT